jgi:hypothetical protein
MNGVDEGQRRRRAAAGGGFNLAKVSVILFGPLGSENPALVLTQRAAGLGLTLPIN